MVLVPHVKLDKCKAAKQPKHAMLRSQVAAEAQPLTRARCMASSLGALPAATSQSSTAKYSLAAMSMLVHVPRYTCTVHIREHPA
jgi:hypothetical protein